MAGRTFGAGGIGRGWKPDAQAMKWARQNSLADGGPMAGHVWGDPAKWKNGIHPNTFQKTNQPQSGFSKMKLGPINPKTGFADNTRAHFIDTQKEYDTMAKFRPMMMRAGGGKMKSALGDRMFYMPGMGPMKMSDLVTGGAQMKNFKDDFKYSRELYEKQKANQDKFKELGWTGKPGSMPTSPEAFEYIRQQQTDAEAERARAAAVNYGTSGVMAPRTRTFGNANTRDMLTGELIPESQRTFSGGTLPGTSGGPGNRFPVHTTPQALPAWLQSYDAFNQYQTAQNAAVGADYAANPNHYDKSPSERRGKITPKAHSAAVTGRPGRNPNPYPKPAKGTSTGTPTNLLPENAPGGGKSGSPIKVGRPGNTIEKPPRDPRKKVSAPRDSGADKQLPGRGDAPLRRRKRGKRKRARVAPLTPRGNGKRGDVMTYKQWVAAGRPGR